MIDQLIKMIAEINDKSDQLFPIFANMYKRAFDELIKVGFSEEQAIKVLQNFKFA